MTDLEKFVDLYKSIGIELDVYPAPQPSDVEGARKVLIMEAGTKDKLIGYLGFFTEIFFDKDGMFLRQGFWE